MLTVLRAFPCRTRLADRDSAPAVEEEVNQSVLSIPTVQYCEPDQVDTDVICSVSMDVVISNWLGGGGGE